MKSEEATTLKGYDKVKNWYKPVTIYFECKAEKEKVMEYAKSLGKSMRQYILQLIFEKKEPEFLEDIPRKGRRMAQNKRKPHERIKYILLVPKEKYPAYEEKAERRKMGLSNYAIARIRADLKSHGVVLDYQESYPFLIMFNSEGEDQDMHANTQEEATEIIDYLKQKGISEILLVDTVNRKRSVFN